MPRVKYGYRTASKETYNKFKLKYPEIQCEFNEFVNILQSYSELFREYILETGDVAKLIWGFGYFTILKKKKNRYKRNLVDSNGNPRLNLPIDWKATKEEGKPIYNFNFHTDGYSYWWKWYKKSSRQYLSQFWYFKASRTTSRELAKYLNKPGSQYGQMYAEVQQKIQQ